MSAATYVVADVLTALPTMPAGSVDLVVTSPPFYKLRSYLPAGHPDKAREHGSEPTPAAFLAQLLDVTEALGRVLAPHGSIAVELGDTYENKSLCGIPAAYELSLSYGRNILALPGQPEWREFRRWLVRNLVTWVKTNPPVGALGDKFRNASSYITVATRSATRYWDDIPTRRPYKPNHGRIGEDRRSAGGKNRPDEVAGGRLAVRTEDPAGAPLLDWWEITPTGFTSRLGQHYATFPSAIVEPLVEACCPRRVCRTCGRPSRRIIKSTEWPDRVRDAVRNDGGTCEQAGRHGERVSAPTTVGWSTCGCPGTEQIRDDGFHDGDGWRPGMVLDCYAGTGTTLLVATGHGRDAIGIDLDERNAALAEERCGMFLTIKESAA